MTELIVVNDDTTRAELEEAMANVVATLHRMPAHWAAHKAKAGIPDAKKRGICNDPECTQPHYAKGACKKHYQRAARGSSA